MMQINFVRGAASWALLSLLAGCSSVPAGTAGPVNSLTGRDDDSAAESVPLMAYEAREEDFTDEHPELPGLPISFNTLLLVFALDTTVEQANAVLADIEAEIVGGLPGITGEAGGILALRVATASHEEMIDILEQLDQDERVTVAVQDVLLEDQSLPGGNGGIPADWTWQVTPTGGNWGMEVLRVPAMWNLNDSIRASGRTTRTGILDSGFGNNHPDVNYATYIPPVVERHHGTHVAGIMAASFDDGDGIDGICPFAELIVKAVRPPPGNSFQAFSASWGQTLLSDLGSMLQAHPDIRVINNSQGYPYETGLIDPTTNAGARTMANNQGIIARTFMQGLGANPPIIVVSAGDLSNINASGFSTGTVDAKYNSPFANAALVLGVANIIVVQGLEIDSTAQGGAKLDSRTNVNVHLSAPGKDILSASFPNDYLVDSGSSMAAPHVAGLISYLYAADPNLPRPTLSQNKVLDLLQANGVAVAGGATDRIDAYAAVLALDGDQLPTASNAPIRHALMDANNDGTLNELDIEDFRVRFVDVTTDQPLATGTADWSRYDLNGDGTTGGPTTAKFDLDRVGSTQYGATSYTSGVTQSDLADPFDENAVTDLDILCYYAYAGPSLYQGSQANLDNLLGELCGATEEEEEEPAIVQQGSQFRGEFQTTWTCPSRTIEDECAVSNCILAEVIELSTNNFTLRWCGDGDTFPLPDVAGECGCPKVFEGSVSGDLWTGTLVRFEGVCAGQPNRAGLGDQPDQIEINVVDGKLIGSMSGIRFVFNGLIGDTEECPLSTTFEVL